MKKFIAAMAATALFASSAMAAVSFDSTAGTGFVGKGDIQVLYGWNNAQLQSRASGVSFAYNQTDTYDVECEWDTIAHSRTIHHDITVPRHTSVNAVVAYDTRNNRQGSITGFNLTGFGTTVTDGTVPVLGGACPGNNPGTITDVTQTGTAGSLSVSYGGVSYDLPNTPVI